jgi:hypothetical protein
MKTDKSQVALSKSYPVLRTYAGVSAILSLAYGLINYFINHKVNLCVLLSVNIALSALFAWYLIRAKNKKYLVLLLKILLVLDVINLPLQILAREFYTLAPMVLLPLATYVTLKKLNGSMNAASS